MPSRITCLALAASLLGIVPLLHADDAAFAKKLAKFPAPVAEALKKAATGSATIDRVSIEKDGKTTVYEASIVETGKPNREVQVTADGKLHAEEETVPMDKLPEAVKK